MFDMDDVIIQRSQYNVNVITTVASITYVINMLNIVNVLTVNSL